MVIDVGWLVLATAAWLRSETLRTRRVDAAIARDVRAAADIQPRPGVMAADKEQVT